jgi:hypothetical protein
MDESIKFVWAYMIESGHLTTGKWSYYGGDFDRLDGYDWRKAEKNKADLHEAIKSIGIDWSKTAAPVSNNESAFTDTFHDSLDVETLLGALVLKDGSEYLIGVGDADRRFGDYIRNIAQLAADKQRVKDILGE